MTSHKAGIFLIRKTPAQWKVLHFQPTELFEDRGDYILLDPEELDEGGFHELTQ